MSKPFTNPFFEADMSKMFDMSNFDMSAMSKMFDMSKLMDSGKMFDMTKTMGNMKMPSMPLFDIEALMALQRKNIEALSAMNQAASEAMMALWRRQADSYRQMMEEAVQMVQAVMACKTPEDKAIKQAEVSKAAMDKYIANLRDASETIARCNTQAMETVGSRVNESLNEMANLVKSNATADAA